MALDIVVISVGAILLVIILGFIVIFNSLITARQKVKNAWAQIDVQLKKRADLVGNLVEVVKGYSKYEKKLLTDITQRRANVMNSSDPSQLIAESNGLASSLKSVFAVAENYPDLKANENFLELQRQLSRTGGQHRIRKDGVQRRGDHLQYFDHDIPPEPGRRASGIQGEQTARDG